MARAIADWIIDYLELELKSQYREKAPVVAAMKEEAPALDKHTRWALSALKVLDGAEALSYKLCALKVIAGESLPDWALLCALARLVPNADVSNKPKG